MRNITLYSVCSPKIKEINVARSSIIEEIVSSFGFFPIRILISLLGLIFRDIFRLRRFFKISSHIIVTSFWMRKTADFV